jgi:putative intracellular protease/amidase
MHILIVLSSADRVPGTDHRTGTWLEELAAPYYVFKDAGAQVTLASVNGGPAPLDPLSESAEAETDATRRFRADPVAQQALASTVALKHVRPETYDAVFYSGGLGPVFDLSEDRRSIAFIETLHRAGKPVAAVCHGVAVLRHARTPTGDPLIKGRNVAGFSNTEELAVNGPGLVPWFIEDEMRRLGAQYSRAADWSPHVVVDGTLITGQNPASSAGAAEEVLRALAR